MDGTRNVGTLRGGDSSTRCMGIWDDDFGKFTANFYWWNKLNIHRNYSPVKTPFTQSAALFPS